MDNPTSEIVLTKPLTKRVIDGDGRDEGLA